MEEALEGSDLEEQGSGAATSIGSVITKALVEQKCAEQGRGDPGREDQSSSLTSAV